MIHYHCHGVCHGASQGALGANLHTLIAVKVAEYIRNCRRDDGRNWTMSFPKKGALKALLKIQDGET